MLAQCSKRWATIRVTLCQCRVFDVWLSPGDTQRLIHVAGSLGSPHPPSLPQLTSRGVLCNIEGRSWLRYLSSKIANFVLLKAYFWPWQLKALQIHIIYTSLVCNTTE